ncbi:Gfo/Idh/MocA family protein [Alloiococcus sp. CFN-8]|uniref:Gfo/Idh/MocA family protein n=1 Tax=Alloiococcus sp. CFN-8 TaxID=3416081 RepID=UPI003CF11AA8
MKIGILGAGNIGGTMAYTVSNMEEAECYAVGSRSLEKAKSFADKYNIKKAYGSYEELVKDPEVELIYIATPHSEHYANAKLCLENGKHVLCEKAFTANAAQAEEIISLAESKGLLITEAIWTRYLPMRWVLQEIIDSGTIGEVTSLTANLGYILNEVKRMVDPNLAGGALLDLGVYPINFASMIFGDDIERVTSDCVKTETGVDGQNTIIITYKGGKVAVLHSNMLAVTDRYGIINGSKGYIEFKNINNCEGIKVYGTDREVIKTFETPKQITGYEYEVLSAIKAIREGRTECPEMPHKETVRIMKLMDSLRQQWGVIYPFEKA